MPVTFLDEEPKPEVSAQPKTGGITFIDETPTVQNPIPEATPYTYGTDPIVDKTLDENKANWEKIGMSVFSDQELADIKAKGPINFFEAAGRDAEWPIYDMTKNAVFAAQLAKRMAMGEELSDGENEQLKKILRHQAEGEIRGYSAPSWYGPGGYVGSGLVQSATFGAELAASAGVGRLAVGTAAKIGTKVAIEEAGKLFVKKTLARKAAEMTAGGVIFTGMNFAEKYGERRLNQFVTITDKGDAFFKQAKETPFTSALMVAGNLGVEYGSELSGGALAAGAKYVSAPAVKMLSPYTEAAAKTLIDKVPAKIKDALFMAYRGINKNATVSNVFSAAGWHGMLAELGEERVADVMKFALNIDDKEGYTFEQAMNAIYPGPEQILVEAGIIGITGGSIAAMNGAANTLASVSEKYGMTRPEAEKMMNSLSQTEIDNLAKEIGTKGIKTQVQQVEGAAFDLARKSGVAEEEARAWSKVAAAQSLWGSKTYGIGPSKYFESLKIGIDNTNPPPMTEKAYKSMMRLEPDYTGGEKLPYQNTIDQLREIQRKSDQKFERYNRAVEKAKAEGRVYKGAKVSRDLPILKYLKKKGGVLIGSPLAAELETMGITSKSEPWLFRKEDARVGTAQGVVTVPALRNLDQIEPKDISDKTGKVFNAIGTSETDTSGNYADPSAILDAIDTEYRNLSTPKDSEDNAWADDMERILGEAGVSLSNTDEEINIALMNYERDRMWQSAFKKGDFGTDNSLNALYEIALKSADYSDFYKSIRQAHLMDLSNHDSHRFGRAFTAYADEPMQDIDSILADGSFAENFKYEDKATYEAMKSPKDTVTIYRAVPESAGDKIRVGDYVALTREYAQMHLLSVIEGEQKTKGKIIKSEVPKTDVVWGQAAAQEWAYSPRSQRDKFATLKDFFDFVKSGQYKTDKLYQDNRAMNAGRDNTYYQSSKIDRMSPASFSDYLSDKYHIDVAMGGSGGILVLSAIKVPEGARGAGIGTKAMKEIINYADKKGLSIALTPTSDFGGNKSRLEKWYKSFGFVENKGKNKDFSTRERFIRSPKKLYQDNRASVQFMQNGKKIITLMAGSDRSSLLHETGHIFLRELENAASESDIASEHLKTVREFVGAKEGEAFTREQEEVFARGFERYLMEGHAPSNFLKDAFESFREWLIEIYQSVMGLNVPMNNEMREVYDALLGGRDLDIYFRPVKIDNHESAWAKFYRYTFDDLAPIHRAVKVAQGIRGKFPDGTNPEWIARLFASSKGRLIENLQNQTYYLDEKGNPVITGEGFKPILEDFDTEFARHEPDYETRFNDLQEYMIAQRYLADLSNKDGITVTEEQKEYSVKTLQRLNDKYGETSVRLPSYAQRIYDFQARILENLVRSGLMSKSDYDGILNGNKHYIPFQRVFEEGEIEEHPFVVGGRGRFISVSNPVKSIKGSTRDVKDPFSQIIINTARVLHAAEKNRVMASIASMSAYLPEEIKPTKQPMTKIVLDDGSVTYRPNGKPKGNVIEYKTDGKRHFVEVSLPMYEALQGMHPVQASLLERFMSGIASFFRAAATLPPDFWIRNFIRDVNSASVQSTHGIKPIDVVKGILAVGEKNDLYNEWMQSGGSFNSYMELDDKGAEKALQELISPKGRMMRYIKSGGIELLKDASGAVEQATRIAMYNRAREKGESGMMAALQSRDGTLDFSRAGKWGRVANRYIPFLNAGLQGTDRLIRAFKSHPGLMTWRAFTTITAPSIAIAGYYLYMAPDDERKEYLEIPQWQKDLFWCFKSNGTWWRIPKPFALGYAFGSVPERFMLWAYHGDKPEAEGIFREVVLGLGGSLSPIQDIGTLMTPVGRIIVESTSNYNFFTGRSIYPEWLDMKPAEERATKYQSETALLLGEVSGQSPAIIENAIRGMLATSTPYVLGAGDGIINAVKEWNGENVPEKPMTPSDKMFIRGFSVRSPEGYRSVSSNNFFEKWTEIKQRHASWNGKEGPEKEEYMKKYGSTIRLYKPMKDFYNRMDKLNDQIDSIYEHKTMSGPEKLRQIEPLEKQITEIAREANSWYLKNKE